MKTEYWENGTKVVGTYQKGRKIGVFTRYTPDGIKDLEQNYGKGGLGDWTSFYPDGTKKEEGSSRYGRPDGIRTSYDENGNVIKTETYKDGQLVQ